MFEGRQKTNIKIKIIVCSSALRKRRVEVEGKKMKWNGIQNPIGIFLSHHKEKTKKRIVLATMYILHVVLLFV